MEDNFLNGCLTVNIKKEVAGKFNTDSIYAQRKGSY